MARSKDRGGRAGVDPHCVQRILRHASVTTTTATYAHLAIQDLRDAVSKIGPQQSEPLLATDARKRSFTFCGDQLSALHA